MKPTQPSKGFSLVEVLVAATILLVVVLSITRVFSGYVVSSRGSIDSLKAAYLAEEGIEAVKIMRDTGWASSTAYLAGTYRIAWNGSTWATTTSTMLIDNLFDRTILIEPVYRDSVTKDIETSGTVDPGTKKVTVSVSWNSGAGTTTKALTTYITNLFDN